MILADPEGLVPGFDPTTELALADLDLLMLSVSDNDATNAIIDALGMEAVNAVGARLGLAAPPCAGRCSTSPRSPPAATTRPAPPTWRG